MTFLVAHLVEIVIGLLFSVFLQHLERTLAAVDTLRSVSSIITPRARALRQSARAQRKCHICIDNH